jgi:hypothetical protein
MRGQPAIAIVCRTLAERARAPALVFGGRTLGLWALLSAAAYGLDAVVGPQVPAGTSLAVVNIWAHVAILIVSALITYALTPKPPQPKPAALADFDVPTAEEGKPICKIFGEYLVEDPNVLWYGDLSSKPIKKKTGKK